MILTDITNSMTVILIPHTKNEYGAECITTMQKEAKMKVLVKGQNEDITLLQNEILPYAQYQALIKGMGTIITTEGAAIEFLKLLNYDVEQVWE